jgi:hypothetical protein
MSLGYVPDVIYPLGRFSTIGSPIRWDGPNSWVVRKSRQNLLCLVCDSPLPAGTPYLMLLGTLGVADLYECCFACYEKDVLGRPTGQLKMVQSSRPDENMASSIKLSVQYHCLPHPTIGPSYFNRDAQVLAVLAALRTTPDDMPDSVSEEEPEEEPEEGPAKVISVIYVHIFLHVYIYIYIGQEAPTSSVSPAVATH